MSIPKSLIQLSFLLLFYGTITKEEPRNLKDQYEETKVLNVTNQGTLKLDEEILDGQCLHSLLDEYEGNGKDKRTGKSKKLLEKNKREKKETHPPTLVNSPMETASVTLHPLRCVDGVIEYKVKCKGMTNPFAKVKAHLTLELRTKDSIGF